MTTNRTKRYNGRKSNVENDIYYEDLMKSVSLGENENEKFTINKTNIKFRQETDSWSFA